MSYTFLLGIALVSAALNWTAVEKHWKWLEYIAKPGTMLCLILWLVFNGGLGGKIIWFTLGATFSLIGDVCLMVPRNLFLYGLFAFLVGHMCYIVGFNLLPANLSGAGLVYLLLIIVIFSLVVTEIYRRLAGGLIAIKRSLLRISVLVYSLVITLMLISALLCFVRPGWDLSPALWAVTGASLFYVSDTILAMDRFLTRFPHARLLTMTTYHLGQVGITIGAALTFLR